MVLFGVAHVIGVVAMSLGMLALGATQVRFAGRFRTHGKGRDLLLQAGALAAWTHRGGFQNQRFKVLPTVQTTKVV